MKSSTTLSAAVPSPASKYTLAVMSIWIGAVLSSAAEKPQPLRDRFGDPLPPGAVRRFGTLRFHHPGISQLAFTPDGKKLIGGGRGSPIVVLDAITGRKLREIGNDKPQSRDLMGFALSPDGKRIAGCGSDVFVWELATGRLIRQFFFNDRYEEVVFSPDGTKIAGVKEIQQGGQDLLIRIVIGEIGNGRHAEDWFVQEGKPLSFSFGGLRFSPDGKYLAGCYREMREEKPFVHSAVSSHVWLLDAATGKRVRTFGSARVSIVCFAFQPGAGCLVTYGKDGILRFWDVETGKEIHHFQIVEVKEENGFGELRFSSDGGRCAVTTNRGKYLTVLDTKDGHILHRIEGKESRLKVAIALSGDGKTLASARPYGETCVRLWDVVSGAERSADTGHHSAPTALSLSSDGRTLISQDETGRRIHWDLQTSNIEIRSFDPREVIGRFDWSADHSQKVFRGRYWRLIYKNERLAKIEVWSLDGAKLIGKLEWQSRLIPNIALSPDGSQLAIAPWPSDSVTVLLWAPEREEKPRTLQYTPDGCSHLIFSHDGKRLIGGGSGNPRFSKGNLCIWNVATTRIVRKLPISAAPERLLLTADDRVLLIGGLGNDAAVHAWNLDSGEERARLADPLLKPPSDNTNWRTQAAITGLALSTDGRFLVVVTSWGDVSAVSVWETGSWKLIRAFAPASRQNNVKAMVFSRNVRSVFVANDDATILEWDVSGRSANGRRQQAEEIPNKDRLNLLWRTLAETPDKAYPAVWEMLDHPAQVVPFLVEKLPPNKPAEEKQIIPLLAQLDSDSFAEREEASRQLIARGEEFLPRLRQALKDRPTLEMKKRLEGILEALARGPSLEQLRMRRALAVLEWSDSTEAGEHLRRLAEGAPLASRTREAKAAWQRRQR